MILHIRYAFAPILHKIVHIAAGYAIRCGAGGEADPGRFIPFLRLSENFFLRISFFLSKSEDIDREICVNLVKTCLIFLCKFSENLPNFLRNLSAAFFIPVMATFFAKIGKLYPITLQYSTLYFGVNVYGDLAKFTRFAP